MKKPEFYAVILSGGSGERFWPFSTPEKPKQFLDVFGCKSLLRQTCERLSGLVPPDRVFVITSSSLVSATRRELSEIPARNIVGEPYRRDTAAAVAAACGIVERIGGENAVAAVLPADHMIGDVPAFRRVLSDAVRAAESSGAIVTMGIAPSYPATGFGYIRTGGPARLGLATSFSKVAKFVEKPGLATAKRYLKSGRYVWNAGMFVWKVSTMKASLREAAPELAAVAEALADRRNRIPAVLSAMYPPLPRISVDYAVMEKAGNMLVSAGDFGWDDVGSWTSLERHSPADSSGNVFSGAVRSLDVSGTIAVSAPGAPEIAALGVGNLVIVSTGRSVLVADKSRLQDLKKLLAEQSVR